MFGTPKLAWRRNYGGGGGGGGLIIVEIGVGGILGRVRHISVACGGIKNKVYLQ